jgi:predicted phage replisome organizer
MSDVKWIKIVVNIFDDEKIRYIETLPNGDETIVIWFRLLCLAGKSNSSGMLMMTDKIAYTDEMLASIFNREIKSIQLALNTFLKLEMIEMMDHAIYIANWNKHQSLEKLEQKKIYDREYQKKKREERLLENRTSIVRADNDNRVTELELEIEVELEEEVIINNHNKGDKKKKERITCLYLDHVYLTDEEVEKLGERVNEYIHYLNMWLEENPAYRKKSKNHYMTILRWVKETVDKKNPDWLYKT